VTTSTFRGAPLAQPGGERGVDLDRHHPRAAGGEGQGQRPPARADLEEDVARGRRDRVEQPLDGFLAEEVLAEPPRHGAG
jgi:hypothetical protein